MIELSGRVVFRVHGGISFSQIRANGVERQFSLHKEFLGEEKYKSIGNSIGLGDFVKLAGTYWTTQKGVLTVRVEEFNLLNKVKHPIPAKFGGVADKGTWILSRLKKYGKNLNFAHH